MLLVYFFLKTISYCRCYMSYGFSRWKNV